MVVFRDGNNFLAPFHIRKTRITLLFPYTDCVCASGNRKQIVYSVVGCLVANYCKWLLLLFILCLCYRYQGWCRGNRYIFFRTTGQKWWGKETWLLFTESSHIMLSLLKHCQQYCSIIVCLMFFDTSLNINSITPILSTYKLKYYTITHSLSSHLPMTLTACVSMQSFRWAIL